MEKTITIDGKKVNLRSSGALPLRYKKQFHRDYFADLFRLSIMQKLEKVSDGTATKDDFNGIDFDFFYNVIWCMAKLADDSIPDDETWLDSFSVFPIFDIIPDILDMVMKSVETKKNSVTMTNFVTKMK